VTARRGELESVLRRLLPRDIREVDGMPRRRSALRHRCRRDARATFQMVDDVAQRCEAERRDAARGRFTRVRIGCQHLANAAASGVANAWHRSTNGPQLPIQRELSETERGDVHVQLPARAEDPEGDRELEAGTFLATLGRREIHRDSTERKLESGVPHRGAHALPRFLHRGVGEPDHDQGRQAVRDVDLDGDERGLEAPKGAAERSRDRAHRPIVGGQRASGR